MKSRHSGAFIHLAFFSQFPVNLGFKDIIAAMTRPSSVGLILSTISLIVPLVLTNPITPRSTYKWHIYSLSVQSDIVNGMPQLPVLLGLMRYNPPSCTGK
jgi:hypothetical protein